MTKDKLSHFSSIPEIADRTGRPESLIRRMVNAKRCPYWIWKPRWREPRFHESSIPEWLRLLDEVDLDALPEDLPPLERPQKVFRGSKKRQKTDLEIILKSLPLKNTVIHSKR